MNPVFLFLSHRNDAKALKAFRRLQKATAGKGPVMMLYHAPTDKEPQLPDDISRFIFRDTDMQTIGFPYYRQQLLPGSTHFPLLHFARQHPSFSHYWVIEYDVYFSGDWQSFFTHWENNDADLLVSHIRHYQDEPGWAWWKLLPEENPAIPVEQRLRAFFPIYRISAKALQHIEHCHRDGWRGHYEMLVPSFLHRDGFRLQDFGGKGSFVSAGDENRFYRDDVSGDPEGRLRKGTMRFRPRFRLPGLFRNKLYHPVK
jgi:hypothetical protein